MFAHNSYAIGGDSIWLKKTKRGVDISCPTNFEYFESIIGYSCKSNDAVFLVIIDYDDLYVEEEFFDEKEVMKNAIILAKTGDEEVKIIEKKSSKWLGQITANVKFEQSYDKGIARVIIFNDGTIISIYAKSEDNTFRTVEQFLSKQIKILDPNQVKELERIQDEYTKKAEELASKKAAEEYKKKLEKQKKLEAEKRDLLERKRIEEEKKKADAVKIKANDDKLKTKSKENIILWREKAQQLDYRFAVVSGTISDHSNINYIDLYNAFLMSIKKYESAINNLKNTSQDKVNKVMKENEKIISQRYDTVNSFLQNIESSHKVKGNAPFYEDQYDKAYGDKELSVEFRCSKKTFSGTVTDRNGSPVVNASVILMYDLKTVSATTLTDVDGKWKIDDSGITFHYVKISASKFNDKKFEREFEYDKNFERLPDSCKFNPIY